jgi:hypothetical protein
MRWRHAIALVTANGRISPVSIDIEASTISAEALSGREIAVWREFKFEAMQVLAHLLRKHLAAARVSKPTTSQSATSGRCAIGYRGRPRKISRSNHGMVFAVEPLAYQTGFGFGI